MFRRTQEKTSGVDSPPRSMNYRESIVERLHQLPGCAAMKGLALRSG